MQNIQIAYKQSPLPDILKGCLPPHFCDAILRTRVNPIEEIRLHFYFVKIKVPLRRAAAGGAHPRRI